MASLDGGAACAFLQPHHWGLSLCDPLCDPEGNVQALNIVDAVFYDEQDVRNAFKDFIDEACKQPFNDADFEVKYLKLVEAIAKKVGMEGIDWDRIRSTCYKPIALVSKIQEEESLRRATLQNQLSLAKNIGASY